MFNAHIIPFRLHRMAREATRPGIHHDEADALAIRHLRLARTGERRAALRDFFDDAAFRRETLATAGLEWREAFRPNLIRRRIRTLSHQLQFDATYVDDEVSKHITRNKLAAQTRQLNALRLAYVAERWERLADARRLRSRMLTAAE